MDSEQKTDVAPTSTDLLSNAAALMRERAEAAMSGPWEVLDSIHRDPYVLQKGRGILTGGCIALASGEDYGRGNAEHIASWDPVVALAVARWLEVAEWRLRTAVSPEVQALSPDIKAALDVARAYLTPALTEEADRG